MKPEDLSGKRVGGCTNCIYEAYLQGTLVIPGVIGTTQFSYDLWGDAINTASRMQSHGLRGRIHLTENTYMRLKDRYQCEQRGVIDVKGKGEMRTYFLVDRKIPA